MDLRSVGALGPDRVEVVFALDDQGREEFSEPVPAKGLELRNENSLFHVCILPQLYMERASFEWIYGPFFESLM